MLDKYHKSHIFKNKLDSKLSYYLAQADITGYQELSIFAAFDINAFFRNA